VILALAGGVFVPPAVAAPLGCGDSVSASIVLDHDIGPCPGRGLTVTADDVVLDLGGHRIFGSAGPAHGPGVVIAARARATVANGTVSGFNGGVFAVGSRLLVTRMIITDNVGPITDTIQGAGILAVSQDSVFSRNRIIHNGPVGGISLSGVGNVIDGNVVQGNDTGVRTYGLLLAGNPHHNTSDNVITGNLIQGNGSDGIHLDPYGDATTVRGNNVVRNGAGRLPGSTPGNGISLYSDDNRVTGNSVVGNSGSGIAAESIATEPAPPPERVRYVGGMDNLVNGNRVVQNGRGSPSARDLLDTHTDCDGNHWSDNTFLTFSQPCVTGL